MKKLLNGLMVFGLVLSAMCVNVNAEHKITELEIEKNIVLDGGELLPTEEFEFEMIPLQVQEGTKIDFLDVKTGVDLGENSKVTISYDVSDSVLTKKANFDLSGLVFDNEAAVYRYEVKETSGNTTAMTYDETNFIVDIYVTNEGSIEYVIAKDSTAKQKKVISFSNTYETETLEVTKEVNGKFADKNKDFTFRLTLDEISTVPAGTLLNATKTKNDETFEAVEITVGNENVFNLKHGEKLVIDNLPQDMTYNVVEDEAEGYTTQVSDTDNGIMDDNGATVSFVNTKIENVETGIFLDTAPYIASVGVACLIVSYLILSRRKEREE